MDINNIPEAFTLALRLSLISCLVGGEKTFKEIKSITKASDGNISIQLSKLEQWGYVKSEKRTIDKKLQTSYEITEFGLNKLEDYVALLEEIVKKHNIQ